MARTCGNFNIFAAKRASCHKGRALFRHLNFQKWSEAEVFSTFHNSVHFFNISTSKSCPNVVCFVHFDFNFFIFHLASWLCTRRFSEPTFQPSGATKHWENTVFGDFPTFSHTCIFYQILSSDFLHLISSPF